ncbi:MAG: phosphotransferase family protein [Candidatus Binatia bacterium]
MKIPALNDFKRTFNDPVWFDVACTILQRHQIEYAKVTRAEHGENIVFLVDERFILKIYTPQKNGFHRERAGLEFAAGKIGVPIPKIIEEGDIEGYYYLVLTQFRGDLMTRKDWLRLEKREQVVLIAQLANGLKELHSHDPGDFDFDWREFFRIQVESAVDKQTAEGGNPEWVMSMPAYFEKYLPLIPDRTADSFQHGDVHFGNLRVANKKGVWHFCGMFDFADSIKGFHEYEFVAIGVLMIQGQGELQREFFRAYGYKDSDIDETLRRRMMMLTMLYEYSSLRRYAERLRPEAVNYTLDELERAIWNFV